MFIILGATGHVGSATAEILLEQGEAVAVVTRDPDKAGYLRKFGAEIAVADVDDVATMRDVFRLEKRLFVLNPPAAPDTDTDRTEKVTVRHLLAALDGSGLEEIVAQSTYGVQPGDHLGDLSTLYAMEQGLAAQPIPSSFIRSAYYMSNWHMMAALADERGTLPTMYPADLKIPMVAPADLGLVAATLLVEPVEHAGIHYVEGSERYSSADVADAFARALGKPLSPLVTPGDRWEATYLEFGFSGPAAKSYARMTSVSVVGNS